MLLACSVGNARTVLALMDGEQVARRFVVRTEDRTADELALLLTQLFGSERPAAAIVSCVVPSALYPVNKGIERAFGCSIRVVGKGLKTGLKLRTDNPREVGSDRIVNAVAAVHTYGAPVVVVRFGTALTVDCVNPKGEYVGGVIAPGFKISEDALFVTTAKLPRVTVRRPERTIGSNTVSAVQAGLYWGFTGLVDRLVERCVSELPGEPTVVGTGGLVQLLGPDCRTLHHRDRDLELRGLALLHGRNA